MKKEDNQGDGQLVLELPPSSSRGSGGGGGNPSKVVRLVDSGTRAVRDEAALRVAQSRIFSVGSSAGLKPKR